EQIVGTAGREREHADEPEEQPAELRVDDRQPQWLGTTDEDREERQCRAPSTRGRPDEEHTERRTHDQERLPDRGRDRLRKRRERQQRDRRGEGIAECAGAWRGPDAAAACGERTTDPRPPTCRSVRVRAIQSAAGGGAKTMKVGHLGKRGGTS